MEYTLTPAAFKSAKAALTRAINSGDPLKVINTVQQARWLFDAKGYPDNWSNWRRAVSDLCFDFSMSDSLRVAAQVEFERWD